MNINRHSKTRVQPLQPATEQALDDPDTTPQGAPAAGAERSRRARGLSVLAATGVALVAWAVEVPAAGVDLRVRMSTGHTQHIGPASVVIMTLLIGLAAWAALAGLQKAFGPRHGRTVWTVVAGVVLLLSLAGPLGAVTTGAVLALLALHLLVGGTLIAGLRRR